MNIESVKEQGVGYSAVIDGAEWVGIWPNHRFYSAIQKFIEDGGAVDPEFTQAELDQNIIDDAKQALAATDADMPRVVEDLVDLLIANGVITETDLPQEARDKLTNRKAKRAAINS